MAGPHDHNDVLPHANSQPQEDSKSLPGSQQTGTVQKWQDNVRNGDATNVTESRRLESESRFVPEPGVTSNGTEESKAGENVNAPVTEGIISENGIGTKQPGGLANSATTKRGSSADGPKPEGSPVSSRVMQSVPRGYFLVERVEMHKKEDGELYFLIKWEGYPESENTWEPFESIKNNTVVREYIQNKGLELPQRKKRKRPILKDLSSQTETQYSSVSSTRKRRRLERDSSAEFSHNAKQPSRRARGRRKAETPVTKSVEGATSGNKGEAEAAALQNQSLPSTKVTPKKQQVEPVPNSDSVPKRPPRRGSTNPSTFVYNLKVEAKRLSPAARNIRLQQLEREMAALLEAGQEDEDDNQ